MAHDLLNPNLPPVYRTTGTAPHGPRQESEEPKTRKRQRTEKRKEESRSEPAEEDKHELDSFA